MKERDARAKRSTAAATTAEAQRVVAEVGTKAVARAAYRKANTKEARGKRAAALAKT
jgi:hypothetical protein